MPFDALGLPRGWPSIELPGYRGQATTYSMFEYDALPPIERQLDDGLSWLLSERPVDNSLAGGHVYDGEPVRPAIGQELDALVGDLRIRLPAAFEKFVRQPEPRTRIRSCTACYLDLGSFPVAVETGGWLIHFLSDQQWVRHWLLFVDESGEEAVVSTYPPYGFDLGPPVDDPEWAADFDPARSNEFGQGADESVVCAASFSEFLYRFWIENEIWYGLSGRDHAAPQLTPEQRHYVEHYRASGRG